MRTAGFGTGEIVNIIVPAGGGSDTNAGPIFATTICSANAPEASTSTLCALIEVDEARNLPGRTLETAPTVAVSTALFSTPSISGANNCAAIGCKIAIAALMPGEITPGFNEDAITLTEKIRDRSTGSPEGATARLRFAVNGVADVKKNCVNAIDPTMVTFKRFGAAGAMTTPVIVMALGAKTRPVTAPMPIVAATGIGIGLPTAELRAILESCAPVNVVSAVGAVQTSIVAGLAGQRERMPER